MVDIIPATLSRTSSQISIDRRNQWTLEFTDELDISSLYAADLSLRGAGADAQFDTADDTRHQLDRFYNKRQSTMNAQVVVVTRGAIDAGQYRIEGSFADAVGHPVTISQVVDVGSSNRGPSVSQLNLQPGTSLSLIPDVIKVQFSSRVDPSTLTTSTFSLRYSADDDFFDGNDEIVAEADGAIKWNGQTRTATFQPRAPLQSGYYLVELNGQPGGIADAAGNLLDGEFLNAFVPQSTVLSHWQQMPSGDGVSGGDYRAHFIVPQAPEIEVFGGPQLIVNRDDTPTAVDGTDFGAVNTNGDSVTHEFRIENTGSTDLQLGSVQILYRTGDGLRASGFEVIAPFPSQTVEPGDQTSLHIRFDPTQPGLRKGVVLFETNDVDESLYAFYITGLGAEPDLTVAGLTSSVLRGIPNGDDSPSAQDGTDFGSVDLGMTSAEQAFFAFNDGEVNLNLTGSPSVQIVGEHRLDFQITQPTSTIVQPNHGVVFPIKFTPQAAGVRTAEVIIHSDDPDENPYSFVIRGIGVMSDTLPPATLSFRRQAPADSLTNADELIFRATFSEPVVKVDASDFVAAGTTAIVSQAVAVSESVYDVTVSGGNLSVLDGVVELNLSSTVNITDSLGNPLPAGEPVVDETYLLDHSAPRPLISSTVNSPTTVALIPIVVDFGEEVVGFSESDITAVGGSIRDFATTNNRRYTFSVSADPGNEVRVHIEGGVAQDLVGLDNRQSNTLSIVRQQNADFGDAAEHYPVLIDDDGARHQADGPILGSQRDREHDGQPSADAKGDDEDASPSDEDGITFLSSIVTNPANPTGASFQLIASQSAMLDAWIDFNRDGDWLDAGERLFESSLDVNQGGNVIGFNIPAGAVEGDTFARFRLSSTGGLNSFGPAIDGEVEDYLVSLVAGTTLPPVSVDVIGGAATIRLTAQTVNVTSGSTPVFYASATDLGSIAISGTSDDDTLTLELADFAPPDFDLRIAGGSGNNRLALTGEGRAIDFTQSWLQVTEFNTLDLSTDKNQSVTLDANSIAAISSTNRLLIVAGDSEQINVAHSEAWRMADPIVRDGKYILTADNSISGGNAVIEAESPLVWQNFLRTGDINNDGRVTASDALRVINELTSSVFSDPLDRSLNDPSELDTPPDVYFDNNGDQKVTALDALRVINELARLSLNGDQAEAEWISLASMEPSTVQPAVSADDRDGSLVSSQRDLIVDVGASLKQSVSLSPTWATSESREGDRADQRDRSTFCR